MSEFKLKELYNWCSIPYNKLEKHPKRRTPFKLVKDSKEMGKLMAKELAEVIKANNKAGRPTRAIIPCGPKCWYEPFAALINREKTSLKELFVFHMDECLDWQGRLLPKNHPYNFGTFMETFFYGPVKQELSVPESRRFWLTPATMEYVRKEIWKAPIDITVGGWGQDGHIAYNQARRHPYSKLSIEDLKNASIRIQDNNLDTVITLAQRTFGAAYQFVPPMSITLGIKECLSAKKVRVYSDTGTWKQTALRVALFSPVNTEYPLTLLQEHKDARICATVETAKHPISENPDWELF